MRTHTANVKFAILCMVVTLFDPWKSRLCTCSRKYSLNPYTGCSHSCIYCYITSYIPKGYEARLKKNIFKDLKRELPNLNKEIPITMSNSSDPYQPIEREYKITRKILKILSEFKVQIITKGDLVTRDSDLLSQMKAAVAITVTTLNEELANKLEPFAPSPHDRLKAMEHLISHGIPVSARIDPIIPYINEDAEGLVKELSYIGVTHITSSTFKPRYDSWRRLRETFPEKTEKLHSLYFDNGERKQNSYYLPECLRLKLMKGIKQACEKHSISFATCREGLNINTAESCDGIHLIN